MGLFRCKNEDCSESNSGPPEFDFSSETGTCPKCRRTHPGGGIVQLVPVHYLVNDPTGLIRTPNGNRKIACQPTARRLTAETNCANQHGCVTCPACRETAVYKLHVAEDVDQDVGIVKRPDQQNEG